jgi:hypothetical protein
LAGTRVNNFNKLGFPITLADGTVAYAEAAVLTDAAGNPYTTTSGSGTATNPKGYQQINSDQLATSQPLNVPAGATRAVVQNNGAQSARYRNDGSDPTGTVGQRLSGGDTLEINSSLASYRFIREAEGVQLDIAYYG